MQEKTNIVFCIIDDIDTYATSEIQTTIRNILDYTISNLYTKGFDVVINADEDKMLESCNDYDYAVVMSPGTEYINGDEFFHSLKKLTETDFFLAGHVLDRTAYDAYYELHHQCYVIDLNYYRDLGYPQVGKLKRNTPHQQAEPIRSIDNWHDDYTPKQVNPGTVTRTYSNQCHGWNLLRLAFKNNLPVTVFDESFRNNKKNYYPESELDFYKNIEYIKYKFNYCMNEFVHMSNTEHASQFNETFEQIVVPASGTLYLDKIVAGGVVVFYDYNQRALDYWAEQCVRQDNVTYKFVKTDLLNSTELVDHLNPNLKTLANLSNVFCYEGTAAFYSLAHRLAAQHKLVEKLNTLNLVTINFSLRADAGHSKVLRNL